MIEIESHAAFHAAPRRDSSRGWMVHLLARAGAANRIATHRDGALGRGVDLPVRAVEWSEQKLAAFQTLGIADRGNRHVHLGAGPRERRQAGGHKHRRHILDHRRRGRDLRPHALHNVGQGLGREYGLLAVPGLREPHHHAVADQGILPHPFNARQIADFDLDRFVRRKRSGKRQHERENEHEKMTGGKSGFHKAPRNPECAGWRAVSDAAAAPRPRSRLCP